MEMRFIEKETKPLKTLIKDALIVYISVILGYYIIEQFPNNSLEILNVTPSVFTDNPSF